MSWEEACKEVKLSLSFLFQQMSRAIFPVKSITIIFVVNAKNNNDNVENYNHRDDTNND